jgi:BolA protein
VGIFSVTGYQSQDALAHLQNLQRDLQLTTAIRAEHQVDIEQALEEPGPTQPHRPVVHKVHLALGRRRCLTALAQRLRRQLQAGHAGALEGRHFSVTICSIRFEGLSRVGRHRLVYDALASLMPRGIHALAIEAHEPRER